MAYRETTLHPSQAESAGGQTPAASFREADDLRAQLDVTAISGTSATLTVTIQDSLDGVNWNDLGSFAAATAIGREVIDITTPHASLVRASWTLTGTTPSATFSVIVVGQ